MAKMVNFGLAYGMSDYGLSTRAGISREDAQEFINSYFAAYSGISYYMLHIKETARQKGYVSTLLGRRRWIPELEARNPSLRAAGERMAINMPIQGTAADIMKIAMIRLPSRLRDAGLQARLLLQVHDEIVLECPHAQLNETAGVVRQVGWDREGVRPRCAGSEVDWLGRALHRPVWTAAPSFMLRAALGEMADTVLHSERLVPAVLQRTGYHWLYPDLDSALQNIY